MKTRNQSCGKNKVNAGQTARRRARPSAARRPTCSRRRDDADLTHNRPSASSPRRLQSANRTEATNVRAIIKAPELHDSAIVLPILARLSPRGDGTFIMTPTLCESELEVWITAGQACKILGIH